MSIPRVWLITGASSGFGLAVTKFVLQSGDVAVATLRTPEFLSDLAAGHSDGRLLTLKLDVTKPDEIAAAFDKAKEVFGRVDVVFNNAGVGVMGEIEGTPDDAARALFETDFWGAANVSRQAVKFFREVNPRGAGGRLLQVTSDAALDGIPALGYYSAAKAALECLSESLAKELPPAWNIMVTNIELGPMRTRITDPTQGVIVPPHPAYSDSMSMMVRQFIGNPQSGDDVNKAAKVVYKLAAESEPPVHFPLGLQVIETLKRKATTLIEAAEKYASWSEDLQHNE